MAKTSKNIYQFKITLIESHPPIWRRIQVPERYSFWDLHVAIQDSMGWDDYHLHEFAVVNPSTSAIERISIPLNDDFFMGYGRILSGYETKIKKYFTAEEQQAKYTYDFGDNWEHIILLEKILPAVPKMKYPVCIGGERACPPEDCGGTWGYEDLLEIIKDPNNEEYEDTLEWLGDDFNPEYFNKDDVRFSDPGKRREFMYR